MALAELSRTPGQALRIGIDARLVTYRRGMGNYAYNLLQEFARRDDAHSFVLYVDHRDALEILPSHPRFETVLLRPRLYPIWEQMRLAARVRQDGLDILHCPSNTGPLGNLGATRLVVTIHDVMYLMSRAKLPVSPSAYQHLGRLYRSVIVPRVALRASRIITDSERSAADIHEHLNLGSTPVDVVYLAANAACRLISDESEVGRICRTLGVQRPFVLAPGAVDPRKNTERVLAAFAYARDAIGIGTELVLFGLTPAGRRRFEAMANTLRIADSVRMLGFVSEDQLTGLYNGCRAFLYPSLYEGFGMPVLEAMTCGAALATANAGSLPEIAGNIAEYADPLDVESIASALIRAIEKDTPARRAAAVARAERFTWAEAAALTVASYEDAAR